jgi:hypothetical protein
MDIKLPNNERTKDYDDFDIHEILVKPFDDIKCKDTDKPFGSTGWYVTITFTIQPNSYLYARLLKHTDPDYNGFYLDYKKDTNTFTYTGAVTKTPTTLGALEELESLKRKDPNLNYRFMAPSYLYNCIETLSLFWD